LEYGRSLKRLLELMASVFSERLTINKFRFHVKTSHVWLPFGHYLASQVTRPKTLDEMNLVLDQFFSQPVVMRSHTDLRQ